MSYARRRRAGGPGGPSGGTTASQAETTSAMPAMNQAPNEEAEVAQEEAPARGPFQDSWLNAALESAFGEPVSDLNASWAQDEENDALGAQAHAEGSEMSFGSTVSEAPEDLQSMEIIAHETAHALGARSTEPTQEVDGNADAGERQADRAGKQFREWASRDFDGPAPALDAAKGGEAKVQRYVAGAEALTGSPMLRRGSSGSQVSLLQRLLNDHGYGLAVDGSFGPITQNAVRLYQSAHGLIVDGIVGPQTSGSLRANNHPDNQQGGTPPTNGPAPSTTLTGVPALKRGAVGTQVKTLQNLLNSQGGHLLVDGEFGPVTEQAVRRFQLANGLQVDGVVGPITAGKLNDPASKDIGEAPANGGNGHFPGNEAYDDLRDAVIAAAQSHLGALYWWGANGPDYFDCSGFVLYVLREDTGLINWGDDTAQGIKNRLPATNTPQRGDPVFFSSGGHVEHVELATGNGTETIGAGGGGSHTYGDNPNAKVKWDSWTADSRPHSFASIEGLIQAKLANS